MLFNTLQLSVRCIRSNVLRPQNIKTIKNMIKAQGYKDWAHRKPVAIINEEIVLDDAEEAQRPRKYVSVDEEHRPLRSRPRRTQKHPPNPEPVVKSDATFKEDGSPNLTKLADDDRSLMSLMMILKSRKLREKNKQILLEGHRLISDAIAAGLKLEIIIFSRTPDVMKLPLPEKGIKLYKVPYKTIQLWSNLITTPGVIGIFEVPESFEKETTKDTIPLIIICDNVREPGNLGSILRAAAGVGCERVVLTKGCVDVWEPKVLRSAAGAHFRVSISKSLEWDEVKSLINPGAKIFAADNNVTINPAKQSNPSVDEKDLGSSRDDEAVPSLSASETNESSGETNEQLVEDNLPDAETTSETESSGKMHKVSVKELASGIPVIPYYSTDYTTNEVVLIVGGETEGLSYESIQLLRESQGVRVNVPLTNEVESLNTGMALGIVAFEVRRQFAIKRSSPIQ